MEPKIHYGFHNSPPSPKSCATFRSIVGFKRIAYSIYQGVSKNFWTESITTQTTKTLVEKQHKGLWQQNLLD